MQYIRYGLGVKEYSDIIGVPIITNLDTEFDYENADYDAEPNDHWVLVVPHLDPGNVSYGSGRPEILKLMYLTWAMTFLLLDTVISMNNQSPLFAPLGSKKFKEEAIKRLQNRSGYEELKQELDKSREQVNEWRRNDTSGKKSIMSS